jgi:type I restriction-modification system DNA methylase subunit
MNREQARDLIQRTFTQKFDRARFLNFTRNLLNHFDESKASSWNSQYVKDAFKNHVQRYERLGTYITPKKEAVDLLVVYLTDGSKLERARTAIRNFVADHLKQRDEKDAALVAFVAPADNTWRFSYVKMEYAAVEKDSGSVGVEARLTPARRFSYIVGEGESCHTAQTRFLALLQDTAANASLADIEEAFSVEAVTKEFFTKYAELFGEIHKTLDRLLAKEKAVRDEFATRAVSSVDFSKKLMGQIVFLYFLQKKGWLGVARGADWGTGPRDFLRRLANGDYAKYDNFFNDVLEPLFYDTLATDRGHEAWCNRFKCRIPFLNGGLFEPLGDYGWRKIDIILPNKLFTNSTVFEEGITGTGVLDVFDRYNFTVNEAEPLEKEVAIDPEMLGKVFENLIEENRRKGLGSYYTPREIVHYMCQESLINYLDTSLNKDKEEIPRTDIDTFVHLGEQISHYEAVKTRYAVKMPNSIERHARRIDETLAEITICDPAVGSGAFPVGMMTEIVRARCALTSYFNDVHERTPYYFKRHAIQNCLYGVDIDIGAVEIAKLRLWLSLVVDEEDVKQIKPLPNLDYKIVAGNSLVGFPFKSQRLGEIEVLKARFFEESDLDRKAALKQEIRVKLDECFASSKKSLGYEVNFDFRILFSEVFHQNRGFNVVIANPPYDEISDKRQKDYYKANYSDVLTGHYDLYIFFFRRAFDLGTDGTTISFITPHTYLQYSQFQNLRSYLYRRSHIREITSRIEGVFESVVVDNAVIFMSMGQPISSARTLFAEKKIDKGVLLSVAAKSLPQSEFSDSAFDVKAIENASVLKRLSHDSELLGDVVDSTQGITIYAKLQGEKVDHFRDSIVDETCKPVTRGREITKYYLDWSGRYIRYGDWLWRQRDARFFTSPKIFLRQTSDTLIGTYVEDVMYCIDSVHSLISKPEKPHYSLKYILGLLNSRLGAFMYQLLICESGKVFAQVKGTFLRRVLVRRASEAQQAKIAGLVDRILTAKRHNPEADTTAWEQEIDRLIYDLYGLTEQEIAVVEASPSN